MEGFEIFVYITLGVFVLFILASIFLRIYLPEKCDKYIKIIFEYLFILSIFIIIMSLFIGGWSGMGYGFIGLSILLGAILVYFINIVIKFVIVFKRVKNNRTRG